MIGHAWRLAKASRAANNEDCRLCAHEAGGDVPMRNDLDVPASDLAHAYRVLTRERELTEIV